MNHTSPAPHPGNPTSFAAHFATPLPRALRAVGESASWEQFLGEYTAAPGPVRLGQWTCTDANRPAARLGPQVRHYQATLAVGDTINTSSAAASGPIAALTEMLHACGITVETVSFHQLPTDGQTATFIEGCDGLRSEWAMGLAGDPEQSALRAVIACANRLMAAA
ncbi:homocitrate synthase [Mycobacterium sp. TNTM28]|uniref:Homocitrate synthase n=1 Tax=[Mycobacterium] fortunisiensis TaxID=2600579 RepID=A0ABS6KL76_9MYCO|nr:homocitrate synthase [[Mycobacterium] fortunisiensis]MBU9764342.1 homocitrate synthase [[Mycobacterium] fortunisiensis]